MIDVTKLARKNIVDLKPYSSARSEFSGAADIFLDANENALGTPLDTRLNRYPDPLHTAVRQRISEIKGVSAENIFLGNGSDEAIDLLVRSFCEPQKDKIMLMPPTYGMYGVCADINNVEKIYVPLTPDFRIDVLGAQMAMDEQTKLMFICSPNNPTANLMPENEILQILESGQGLVVIDEAYIDFASDPGWLPKLNKYSNLVILQTLSKAWGMASIRLGMAFADEAVIRTLNKVKPPYNVNGLTQQTALKALENVSVKSQMVEELKSQRALLQSELAGFRMVEHIFPTDANFILVRFTQARRIYEFLLQNGVIVRDRTKERHCENCLRITVGTKEENRTLLQILQKYEETL